MRRLIVEFSLNDLGTRSAIFKLKSLEIVHILRLEPSEFCALVKVDFGDSPVKIRNIFSPSRDAKFEYELLEREKGTYTYFVKITAKPQRRRPRLLSELTGGGYLSTPFEVRDGKVKVTFLATQKQVKKILESLEQARMKYKIISLLDAKFSPDSPLQRLTEKQREVLTEAYKLGYYDRPRKIDSEQLAQRLSLAKSTLVAHRRKAERRLIAEVLSES